MNANRRQQPVATLGRDYPAGSATGLKADLIRFRAISRDGTRDYEMPWSEQPVAKFRGLPADMLHGAVLYLDEDEIDRRWAGAQQAVMEPETKPKRKR